MDVPAPFYYHSLAPVAKLFERGFPILTYHKLGPKAFRARLKGLYVSKALFKKQCLELRQAGYQSAALDTLVVAPKKGSGHIAITFDDGFSSVLKFGLAVLAETGLTATQFLPANLLGKCNEWDLPLGETAEAIMNPAQVRDWLAAGHQIGSHTCTHPWLTRIPLAQAREEISASKKKLEDLFGIPIKHFCYPYGDWNPAVRNLVAAAGYQTACTTDYGVNADGSDPFSLKRITVRYPSRNWKTLKAWVARKVNPSLSI
jgi:peptidoglycan/xylan/chitin deacetylase (PgdA/CDA1 family)